MQALLKDTVVSLPLRIWTDSSAAMGALARQDLGKLRHLECHSARESGTDHEREDCFAGLSTHATCIGGHVEVPAQAGGGGA